MVMIAICGELPADLAGQIIGSESYAAALITQLKKTGYISLRNKENCRGYVLKKKGRKYVFEQYGEDTAFFLRKTTGTGHVKSELNKRIRLHRMSQVWVFLWKSGVCIFRSQKSGYGSETNETETAVYYGSLEYKEFSDGIQGSRACGVLLSRNCAYVVYNTMEKRMKWAKKMERSMRVWTEKMLMKHGNHATADALIFGKRTDFILELLNSDGGPRKDLFQVDDIYEHYYYIPMSEEADVQLLLLLDIEKKKRLYQFLGNMLSRRKEKEYAICDGYDSQGEPVYFCHELELCHLLRVKQELAWQQKGTVVCLDYQEVVLSTYFGAHIKIQLVITDRLKEYLQQDT